MNMRLLALLVFLSHATVSIAPSESVLEGAWLDATSKWVKAPRNVAPTEQWSQTAVLFFTKDRKFTLIYCTVLRVPKKYINISNGDPRVVYRGEWAINDNEVSLTYRLVEQTVSVQGQTLPGPIQRSVIKMQKDNTLSFDGKPFRREAALNASASQ